ncbi:MAG TPA: hypothetical protein VFU12_18295 [Glycomyces sp.]|nr:hypothetical protein [Glycomyces sp.]
MKPHLFISASMAVFAFIAAGAAFTQENDHVHDSAIHLSPVPAGVQTSGDTGSDPQDWIWE